MQAMVRSRLSQDPAPSEAAALGPTEVVSSESPPGLFMRRSLFQRVSGFIVTNSEVSVKLL